MFIYNLKLNGNKLAKNFFVILLVIILIICGIITYRIFGSNILKMMNSNKVKQMS